jgi:hypothetical protein
MVKINTFFAEWWSSSKFTCRHQFLGKRMKNSGTLVTYLSPKAAGQRYIVPKLPSSPPSVSFLWVKLLLWSLKIKRKYEKIANTMKGFVVRI